MDIEELNRRIDAANDQFVSGEDAGPAVSDLYRSKNNARIEIAKKRFPKGSRALVKTVTKAVITGDGVPAAGLAAAYRRARDDSEVLKNRGERERSDISRQQYMEDHFLPAVEVVVNYSSPDEVLNCKEALDALDKFVLGVGSGKGYTASYIRSAYKDMLGKDLGGRYSGSDDSVREAVMRIKALSNAGENRSAIGIASRIKRQIDAGESIANDEDYAIIGRVAAFGN